MKSNLKITAIMLMLIVAGSMEMNAQPGRGMRPDSTFKGRMDRMQMPEMGMRHGMGRMNNNFVPPYGNRQMRQGFGQQGMAMHQQGRGERAGIPGLYNVPNLTDKQKKDIADLKGRQQAEMEKLRIDMQSKMKELRDSHRTKVMSLLTDEQKKWLDENFPAHTIQK